MDLQTRLTEEMKAAMKSGSKDRLMVIRMLLSDVKNADLQPGKPTPEQVVAAYGKKLRKSLEEFEKLGKTEEVAKLRSEIAIVEEFLPKKLSPDETAKLVEQFLSTQTFTEKQVGQAMGAFMKAHGANVDASIVNGLIRKKLTGQ